RGPDRERTVKTTCSKGTEAPVLRVGAELKCFLLTFETRSVAKPSRFRLSWMQRKRVAFSTLTLLIFPRRTKSCEKCRLTHFGPADDGLLI
ncbi:MAG TPA: hypothetical protein VG796_13095, partial [Verrucomicrobiales bacterium]|nr:hypothetical protein [Verrucomicrobiales bacterium]